MIPAQVISLAQAHQATWISMSNNFEGALWKGEAGRVNAMAWVVQDDRPSRSWQVTEWIGNLCGPQMPVFDMIETPLMPCPDQLSDPAVVAQWLAGRKKIGGGGYANIYQIGNVAVKIGHIPQIEAENQSYLFGCHIALPVLAYVPSVALPVEVTREVCPIHGKRLDDVCWNCHCGEPMAILVMPVVKPLLALPYEDRERRMPEFHNAMALLDYHAVLRPVLANWDARLENVGLYREHVVLLDFGPAYEHGYKW